MSERAHRHSFNNLHPMPAQSIRLDYSATFTADEFAKIAQGVVPQDMDDKWLAYTEGDVLYLHRSWTGFCIYEVHFAASGQQQVVQHVLVNRDRNQYNSSDEDLDRKVVNNLIESMLRRRS